MVIDNQQLQVTKAAGYLPSVHKLETNKTETRRFGISEERIHIIVKRQEFTGIADFIAFNPAYFNVSKKYFMLTTTMTERNHSNRSILQLHFFIIEDTTRSTLTPIA
mmetsp:Transcript_4392/g.5717  ORF Transcript_4392/g.5717 Transcript_4392/m.5717 type:complete len:107 (+) Transcript_4392:67-387(+)